MKRKHGLLAFMMLLSAATMDRPVHAEDQGAVQDASKHFQHAVSLFNEADYRAALTEFRRAYEIAPNPAVLYDIAQTEFQLQNYAGALTTFERFLAEAPPGAKHRDEAQSSVSQLKSRVGKIDVTTNVPGAEIAVDDEVVGRSPLGKPVLVSIGRRKVTVTVTGRVPVSKVVDVGAGDTLPVSLPLAEVAPTAKPAIPPSPVTPAQVPVTPAPAPSSGVRAAAVGVWVTTGVLAAAGAAMGVVAVRASKDLASERSTFPTSRTNLDDRADKLKTFSVVADVLGAAAIVAGGVSIYLTVASRGPVKVDAAASLNHLSLRGSF